MVITMAKLRIVHASTHGARKPPGPKVGDYNGQYICLTPAQKKRYEGKLNFSFRSMPEVGEDPEE